MQKKTVSENMIILIQVSYCFRFDLYQALWPPGKGVMVPPDESTKSKVSYIQWGKH